MWKPISPSTSDERSFIEPRLGWCNYLRVARNRSLRDGFVTNPPSTPFSSELQPDVRDATASGSNAPHRKRCLYLATFDPTGSTSGTAVRGRLFLRAFADQFDTRVVHMTEKHVAGTDRELVDRLAGVRAIDYSTMGYFLFSPSFYREVSRIVQAGEVDFVFADFEKSGLYAYLLYRRFGIPYVYSSHNVEYLRYVDFAKTRRFRYAFVPYLYFVERLAARNARLTISISTEDAKTFSKWIPPERLELLPCAFDESVIHPNYDDVDEGRPVVLLVGNYRNAGNRLGALHVFHNVLPKVIERHPRTIFRFVGKDLPQEIRHPNVEWLDFVEDLLDQYRRATVVVAPIEIGGGIKIKVIEALAAGRYLVATEKAMEGIPVDGLANLEVVPLAGFADSVIRAIAAAPPKATQNYERVRAGFGSQTQLAELIERIHAVLGTASSR